MRTRKPESNTSRCRSEEGTIQLVINELQRRLAEYNLIDKTFREKYQMDFDDFKRGHVVEESGHSFQVEEDYCDWELAIDGIQSISTELEKLAKYT